jgi:hypothetical protein
MVNNTNHRKKIIRLKPNLNLKGNLLIGERTNLAMNTTTHK